MCPSFLLQSSSKEKNPVYLFRINILNVIKYVRAGYPSHQTEKGEGSNILYLLNMSRKA